MSTSNKKLVRIEEKKVNSHLDSALDVLCNITHSIMKETLPGGRISVSGGGSRESHRVNVKSAIEDITEDKIASEIQNTLTLTLRKAIAISTVITEQYKTFSGYNALDDKAKSNRILEDEKVRYNALEQTVVAIGMHVISSYVIFKIGHLATNTLVEADYTPVEYSNASKGLSSFLYNLEENIKTHASDDEKLINVVINFFEKLQDSNIQFAASAQYTETFLSNTFLLESEQFEIDGFEKVSKGKKTNLIMKRVEPKDVVGNAIAKYQVSKLAKAMMCYDMTAKKNPFAELGGFTFTFMGDGNPGTGKTTLIQMLCTTLNDYCKHAGYSFYYENFSTDQISEFQGKSGQNAKRFVDNVLDPNSICFGTIDDIDQIAGKRGDKNCSSGQQEITAVLMEAFAGANTMINGNCVFGMFSNYPEKVDDALRQRASARFLIDGPQTKEDFGDLLTILLSSATTIEQGDRDPFATQELKKAVSKSYEKHNLPQEERLIEVYNKTLNECGGKLQTIKDFETYLYNIKEADERFTGRAIQNIVNAAKNRAMDIDLPDEWFLGDKDLFLNQPYEVKFEMIKKMVGKVTPEMLIQETNLYADSEFRYSGKSNEAEISGMVRNRHLSDQATKRYTLEKQKEAEEAAKAA